MSKPVRNDRVVINAIRQIRKEGKLLTVSQEEKLDTLRAISALIERMKFDQNHRKVATTWRGLVAECFPNDPDPFHRFSWVDENILNQR